MPGKSPCRLQRSSFNRHKRKLAGISEYLLCPALSCVCSHGSLYDSLWNAPVSHEAPLLSSVFPSENTSQQMSEPKPFPSSILLLHITMGAGFPALCTMKAFKPCCKTLWLNRLDSLPCFVTFTTEEQTSNLFLTVSCEIRANIFYFITVKFSKKSHNKKRRKCSWEHNIFCLKLEVYIQVYIQWHGYALK